MKNIFQTLLANLLIAGSLLAIAPLSANRDRTYNAPIEASLAFNKILTTSWQPGLYKTLLYNNWPFWTVRQQALIIERLLDQDLISPEQAEESNWMNLAHGPFISSTAKGE